MMGVVKTIPEGAKQRTTMGPYSPVLEVQGGKLVVISGQVPINAVGEIVGKTIEEQTRAVLENCKTQLGYAGCTFDNVFKATVFMADLADFKAMNAVYMEMMPQPYPTRSTIQAGLLPGFQVEIEMWAAK